MLGYVASIAFYFVPDQSGIVGLRWRLMLGSAAIPPLFVISLIFFSPESPRWYMSKGRKADAYYAMRRIRNTPLEAARDLYFASELLQAEREIMHGQKSRIGLLELFATPRNRLAAQSSSWVMLMQQFCGKFRENRGGHLLWLTAHRSLQVSMWLRECGGRRPGRTADRADHT